MQKAGIFFLILLVCFSTLLYAQEDDSEPPFDDDWDVYSPDLYAAGDQTFIISLGLNFPTLFIFMEEGRTHNFSPPVGGMGNLSYNYFLGSSLFVGGEIGATIMTTLGDHFLYIIPFGGRVGYQFYFWRFEFPVSFTFGMTWQKLLSMTYYGMYAKLGGAMYYRFNSDWSFGLNVNWAWFPQIGTRDQFGNRTPNTDVHGNFIELMLSARYHF
jgi:hypothetical protein